MAEPRKSVLLALDVEELAALDRWWRAVGFSSRRAGIRAAIATAIAQHAAHVQRERQTVAEPNRWLPDSLHTSDRAGEASRPLTADLGDLA